jgi:cytoskeletal protein RodZ
MNTNRISNKNMKRFAIAAGATAAVLFLSAGLVASRGGESNNNKNADAPLAVVSAPSLSEVVEEIVADAPIATQPAASATASTATKSTASTKVASTPKKSKKSPIPAGNVIVTAPDASTAAAPETTVAPAPAVAEAAVVEAAVVSVPTEQPAVEQPAPTAPAEQPAAASSAPASQSGTTAISVPKLTMNDSLVSSLQGIDLTKQPIKTTLPKLCIPGVTC